MRYTDNFHNKRIGHPRYPIMATASLEAHAKAHKGDEPSIIVDVGCSVGALLAAIGDLKTKRPLELHGLDYSVKEEALVYKGTFTRFDLNKDKAVYTNIRGDLIICQEVLEHIEPENTEQAIESLTQFSAPHHATLIFSAAHPGQPGKHHVNCRPKEEWCSLLNKAGWQYSEKATKTYLQVLRAHKITRGCYVDNTQCFYRG